MLAVLLVSIIANGFIILRFSPSQFYKLHRYDGQLLYIKTSFVGILSIGVAFLIDSFFGITNMIAHVLPQKGIGIFFKKEHLQACLIFTIWATMLSTLYCIFNRIALPLKAWWLLRGTEKTVSYSEISRVLLMDSILNDSPLDKLLFDSYVQNIFLLVTMSDRKVYVGRVISLGEPNEKQGPDQEISIVPAFSGYRDKDLLEVNLTTCYHNNESAKEMYLVLKQDNIISACTFDESLYERAQSNKKNTE